jgi:hypothetical protein
MSDIKFYIKKKWQDGDYEISSFEEMIYCEYIPMSQKTTVEINNTVEPQEGCIVWDTNLKMHKTWNGTTWKLINNT